MQLEAQANWKVLLDRVIDGQLDGAHMLAGQPLGAAIGFGTKADIVTAFSMDMNGNAITVSNAVWAEMKKNLPMQGGKVEHPIKADALKKVVDAWKKEGKTFKMGMVFPVSTHNYELRYWLAAGGMNPGYYTATDISGTAKARCSACIVVITANVARVRKWARSTAAKQAMKASSNRI